MAPIRRSRPSAARVPAPRSAAPGHAAAVLRAALLTFVALVAYEGCKSALFPRLTIWESHAMTIAVGTLVAAVASAIGLRRQARLHARLVAHEVAAAEARGSEARYRRLVEASPEAMVVHRAFRVLYANPACVALLDHRDDAGPVGADLRLALDADGVARLERRLAALDASPAAAPLPVEEYVVQSPGGRPVHVEALTVRVTHDGAPAYLTMLRDVGVRKALEAQLVHRAHHDALTELPNRAALLARLALALARAARGDGVAVLMLDLDHFKRINDAWGHAVGDALLREVARRLQAATRGHDLVARLGGDEFVVLLERLREPAEVEVVVARILDVMRAPVTVLGRTVQTTVTIGIAHAADVAAPEPDRAAAVLRHADLALYAAKRGGRDRAVAFTRAMHADVLARHDLERALHRAIAALEAGGAHPFTLVYQPIVDLATRAVRGVEALLR